MFSRKAAYFFVRPKKKYLEVCVFLGRTLKAPQVHRVDEASKTKRVHFFRITHRDEVEPPFTDWLREAYELPDVLSAKPRVNVARAKPKPAPKKKAKATPAKAKRRSRRR